MAVSANAKSFWLLVLGAALVALLLLPLRLTPVVTQTIASLPIQARAQLVQTYEPMAQTFQARADSMHQLIVRRYGGVGPTQDSLLKEYASRATQMLQITSHLRNPSKATDEEDRQDVSKLLERLKTEALSVEQELREDWLR
jgi:hypothetical protein